MRSTDDASASFVSSTASDRKGFVKGESVPLDRVFGSFYTSKRNASAASGANYAFAKGSATPTGDYKFGLKFLLLLFMGEKQALPGTNGAQKRDFAL